MGIMDLYETETNRRFIEMSRAVADDCRNCKWLNLCRGGCRRDRENTLTGELVKNYYCRAYSSFFDYAYPKLQEIAEYIRSRTT